MWERSVLVGAGDGVDAEEEEDGLGVVVFSERLREAKLLRREVESPASVQNDM